MQGFVHIVDDDAPFLTVMERCVKRAGYEVMTYASPQQLLDRLPSEGAPGCIVLDVQLRGLDGPALQTRLGELGVTLPIVFLTGYLDIPTTVRVMKAGADDCLTKPISSDDLLRAVEAAIARHQASRDLQNKRDVVRA